MATPNTVEVPSAAKQKEIFNRLFHRVKEIPEVPEIPREIEQGQVIQGATVQLPQPVTDDQGRVLVKPPAPQQPKITLPLTQDQVQTGLTQKVSDSFRWLAEWCQRLLKKAFLGEGKEKVS